VSEESLVEIRDVLARPIRPLHDAEALAERARARVREGNLEAAERDLVQLSVKIRASEAILAARRARLG
jgi:hypothetical protein